MPPIDVPSNVTDADQKQAHSKREVRVRQISNVITENSGEEGQKLVSSTHEVASPLYRCLETHQPCHHNHPKVSYVPATPTAGIVIFTGLYI